MMQATAVIPSMTPGHTSLTRPVVLIDGVAATDLAVERLTIEGPFDARSAVLSVPRQASANVPREQADHKRWLGRSIVIAHDVAFSCGETERLRLFIGRITELAGDLSARRDRLALHAVDAWTDALGDRVGVRDAGTVEELIERLAGTIGTERLRVSVSSGTLGQSLRFAASGELTVQTILSRLDDHHQIIARQVDGRDGPLVELRERRHRRPVVISQGAGIAGTAVTARTGSRKQRRPIRHIVRADGERVESTFELLPAWSAADEAGADADYQRSTSSDWPRFANVYRLWLLNETGELGEPRFDIGRLIGESRVAPAAPLPFGHCLTQDAAGQRLEPVAAFSSDGGANWQPYPGRLETLEDRGGVRLVDDALPAAYLAAARTADVMLRLTASVQSPWPIERVRWSGNPFTRAFETRVTDVGHHLSVRRVLATSRFAGDIASGQRTADQLDDRPAMDQMLVDAAEWAIESRSRVYRTSRVVPGLAIGDRIIDGLGGPIVRIDRQGGGVMRIEHRWDDAPGSTIHVT